MNPTNILYLEPLGKIHGSHVTPTDHTYFKIDKLVDYEEGRAAGEWIPPYDVLAPADGIITHIEVFPFNQPPAGMTGIVEDYRVVIWHSCSLSSIFIHLGGLAPEITERVGPLVEGSHWFYRNEGPPLSVREGQVIGKVGSVGFDFSVHDTNGVLDGFVDPARYADEPWKIHTVDPFDYFAPGIRDQLLQRNPRTAAPRGGKIDYDIDGRLVGNWFLDDTKGNSDYRATRPDYWVAHLSIAYDYINPNQIRIAVGAETGIGEDRCRVCQQAYGVRGNKPDPASVSVDAGLIKYELVGRQRLGESRAITVNVEQDVLGVLLARMLDDRSIKLEVFPDKTAAQVDGFSEAASVYRR